MFLGGGFIKITPAFVAHVKGTVYGNTTFRVKVNDYFEDVDAMKVSWDAIEKACYNCGVMPKKIAKHNHASWRPFNEAADDPWDESVVDRVVDRLFNYHIVKRQQVHASPEEMIGVLNRWY